MEVDVVRSERMDAYACGGCKEVAHGRCKEVVHGGCKEVVRAECKEVSRGECKSICVYITFYLYLLFCSVCQL